MAKDEFIRANEWYLGGGVKSLSSEFGSGEASGANDAANRVAHTIGIALRAARAVRLNVLESVIPALPPARRAFADWLVCQIDQDAIFSERALRDIDAFMAFVEHEVAAGTKIGWEADEHHVRGGYEITCRDDCAKAIAAVLPNLHVLRSAIAQALDVARVDVIAMKLTAN